MWGDRIQSGDLLFYAVLLDLGVATRAMRAHRQAHRQAFVLACAGVLSAGVLGDFRSSWRFYRRNGDLRPDVQLHLLLLRGLHP